MKPLLRRYGLFIGIAAVFLLVFVLLLPSVMGRDTVRDHSAFRKNRWGCAALAELCVQAEPPLAVTTLTQPLDDLSPLKGFLLILDPETPFDPSEVKGILRWVEGGGQLLLAMEGVWDDPAGLRASHLPAYDPLAAAFGVCLAERDKPQTVAYPTRESFLAQGVRRVAIRSRYALQVPAANDEPRGGESLQPRRWKIHLTAEGAPIFASFAYGNGEVYVSADAEMFANAMLGRADNLVFVSNLLWTRARFPVLYFDEYHHGFGKRSEALVVVDPAPLYRALFVVAFGMALFLSGRAIRFGAAVPAFTARRRTALEYVEALAGLLHRGQAYAWALTKIATAFRHRLAAQMGLASSAPPTALTAALAQRRGISEDRLLELFRDLEVALEAPSLGLGRVFELVERMTDLEKAAHLQNLAPRGVRIREHRL
ncbi:MAG: DUF4350 domain-containing protein [Candidatus Zipacnadales bacterium]